MSEQTPLPDGEQQVRRALIARAVDAETRLAKVRAARLAWARGEITSAELDDRLAEALA